MPTTRRNSSFANDIEDTDLAAGISCLPAGNSRDIFESRNTETCAPWPVPPTINVQRWATTREGACLSGEFRPLSIVEYFRRLALCDECDGPANDGRLFVTISDKVHGKGWRPMGRSAGSRVEAEFFDGKTLAWEVADKNNLIVFGFEDANTKKIFFVTAAHEGPMMLSGGTVEFDNLTESKARNDPRVFQLDEDKASDSYIMTSFAKPELYINLISEQLIAQKSDKKHATAWMVKTDWNI